MIWKSLGERIIKGSKQENQNRLRSHIMPEGVCVCVLFHKIYFWDIYVVGNQFINERRNSCLFVFIKTKSRLTTSRFYHVYSLKKHETYHVATIDLMQEGKTITKGFKAISKHF